MTAKLGKLENVDVRAIWKNEERDFSPWLKENISFLSEILGEGIEDLELEQDVGSFSSDMFGKTESTNLTVVIENQFGETDHDHLGKLLTYMAGKNAKVGVWIAEKFRPEHASALEYLNENSKNETAVFGIQLEVKKIGDSPPAPVFSVITRPNEWERSISQEGSRADKERWAKRQEFWGKLITEYKRINSDWNPVKPGQSNSLSFGAGKSGLSFNWVFKMREGFRFAVELEIHTHDIDENKRIFEELKESADQIEKVLRLKPDFHEILGGRYCRVEVSIPTGVAFTKISNDEKEKLVRWGAEVMRTFSDLFARQIKEP